MSRSFIFAIGIAIGSAVLICAFVTLLAIVTVPGSPSSEAVSTKESVVEETAVEPATARVTTGALLMASVKAYESRDLAPLSLIGEQLASRGASKPEQDLVKAMQLALEGDASAALDLLFVVSKNPSTKAQALSLAGELLFLQQDFQSAEGVLQAAVSADTSNPKPHRWLAAYYYDVGAMDDALYHLGEVAKLAPKDARPWRMRGLILQDFERHAEAVDAYKEALRRELTMQVANEVHAELGASLLAVRNPAEALEHLALAEVSPDTLALCAECNLSLGNIKAAEANIAQSLEVAPTHAHTLQLKANIAREKGDKNLAVETLEFAVAQHPYEFDLRFHLMAALSAVGRSDDALVQKKEMDRLRKLRDQFTQLHHDSMADPSSAQLRYELGQTAEQLGKFPMALSWYKAAIAIDPSFEDAAVAFEALSKRQAQE